MGKNARLARSARDSRSHRQPSLAESEEEWDTADEEEQEEEQKQEESQMPPEKQEQRYREEEMEIMRLMQRVDSLCEPDGMRFAFVRMTLARALTVGTVLSYTVSEIHSEFITADPTTYNCSCHKQFINATCAEQVLSCSQ